MSRCLAVAECVRERGGTAEFVLNDPAPWVLRLIAEKKFAHYPDPLEADSQAGPGDWIVIDDYSADISIEKAHRRAGASVMVFEDVPGRRHDCDVLIDPGGSPNAASDYYPLVPAGTALYLGPRFAPLRTDFRRARAEQASGKPKGDGRGNCPAIWIFFGRVDHGGLTASVLEAFLDDRFRGACQLHVVITDTLAHASRVSAAAQKLGAHIHGEIGDMASFLSGMDAAIGAAGVGLWEYCCLGIPCLSVAVAENQMRGLATATGIGAAALLQPGGDSSPEGIRRRIAAFLENAEQRAQMSDKGRRAVDGAGARRIAALLNDIEIRPAAPDDCRILWDWANDPAVRSAAVSGARIPWNHHTEWFRKKLGSPDSRIYVGCIEGVPIGQVRFDGSETSKYAEIDISIASDQRGRRLGAGMLLQAEAAWRREFPDRRPCALVKRSNHSSLALFKAAGYTCDEADTGELSDLVTLKTAL